VLRLPQSDDVPRVTYRKKKPTDFAHHTKYLWIFLERAKRSHLSAGVQWSRLCLRAYRGGHKSLEGSKMHHKFLVLPLANVRGGLASVLVFG
jgi:hypothetical protein